MIFAMTFGMIYDPKTIDKLYKSARTDHGAHIHHTSRIFEYPPIDRKNINSVNGD